MKRTKKRHGMIRHGMKSRNRFLRPMKKVRGKIKRQNAAVKVHSVTDTYFVLSTSFATYKIPRSYSPFFEKASQKAIQNVVGLGYETSLYGEEVLSFYWYDLDSIWDTDNFQKFRITKIQ